MLKSGDNQIFHGKWAVGRSGARAMSAFAVVLGAFILHPEPESSQLHDSGTWEYIPVDDAHQMLIIEMGFWHHTRHPAAHIFGTRRT